MRPPSGIAPERAFPRAAVVVNATPAATASDTPTATDASRLAPNDLPAETGDSKRTPHGSLARCNGAACDRGCREAHDPEACVRRADELFRLDADARTKEMIALLKMGCAADGGAACMDLARQCANGRADDCWRSPIPANLTAEQRSACGGDPQSYECSVLEQEALDRRAWNLVRRDCDAGFARACFEAAWGSDVPMKNTRPRAEPEMPRLRVALVLSARMSSTTTRRSGRFFNSLSSAPRATRPLAWRRALGRR